MAAFVSCKVKQKGSGSAVALRCNFVLSAVRFVQLHAIRTQLDMGNLVLLTNLAYSVAGEVLNCNIYDVATHAAIELGADKLICMTLQVLFHCCTAHWCPIFACA